MILEPISRKILKPQVNPEAPVEGLDLALLQSRGRQLVLELDRQANLLIRFAREGLKPDSAAWNGVRRAKTDFEVAYSELMGIAKAMNRETNSKNKVENIGDEKNG